MADPAMPAGLEVRLCQTLPIPLAATFACPPGELLALVGPSGAGKSTILRAVAGLHHPAEGRIAVNGEVWLDTAADLRIAPHRRRAGLVFQSYALFPHLSALDNVAAALGHRPRHRRADLARELLDLVHLGGLEARRPAELSGGQQQRVAVARALAREPLVLLLDEPFSAVDRATREKLYEELAAMRRRLAMPIVLVTHDMTEATMLADRLVLLHRGTTLQAGPPLEVMARPKDALVARLVGQTNLFAGTVADHENDPPRTWLTWGPHRLEALYQPAFAAGTSVVFLVQRHAVLLHRQGRPSLGWRENPVRGRIEQLVTLGETSRVRLRPDAPAEHTIDFALPTHAARRNGLEPGLGVTVSLLADGIHLMPARPIQVPDQAADPC